AAAAAAAASAPSASSQHQQQQPSDGSTAAATAPPVEEFDSFSFTRTTTAPLRATLVLEREEPDPESQRFKLSPELAHILDRTEDTRSNIVVGLFEYVRALNLQESEEQRSIRCDEPLRRLFGGREKVYFAMIPEAVAAHTSVADPVRVPFTIPLSSPPPNDDPSPTTTTTTIYDIAVSLPSEYNPLAAALDRILSDPAYPAHLHAVASLDDQLALVIQTLGHSKAKHAFLTGFAADPATFVRKWLSSQKRDLSMILGEGENGEGAFLMAKAGQGGDALALAPEFRRGGENGVWDSAVAREAVRYMLAKPTRGRPIGAVTSLRTPVLLLDGPSPAPPARAFATSQRTSQESDRQSSPISKIARTVRSSATKTTETYVAYGATRSLFEACSRQADYTVPQALTSTASTAVGPPPNIPRLPSGEDLGVGSGASWWYSDLHLPPTFST
ncbi:SWI/SNF complex component snf12, partial [Ascosphaera acerosa]